MVHEFQLSVGGQVYLGETWGLTTGLQRLNASRVCEGDQLRCGGNTIQIREQTSPLYQNLDGLRKMTYVDLNLE